MKFIIRQCLKEHMVFTDGFVFMLQSPEAALDYVNFSGLRKTISIFLGTLLQAASAGEQVQRIISSIIFRNINSEVKAQLWNSELKTELSKKSQKKIVYCDE